MSTLYVLECSRRAIFSSDAKNRSAYEPGLGYIRSYKKAWAHAMRICLAPHHLEPSVNIIRVDKGKRRTDAHLWRGFGETVVQYVEY